MNVAQPLHLTTLAVEEAWIDYNGHMNVGYYGVAFDRATDVFIDRLGMDAAYRKQSRCSLYVLEARSAFLHELKNAELVAVDVQLLDFDSKRLHYFMRMLHNESAEICAWSEIMLMHVDMDTVSGTAMPEAVMDHIRQLARTHRDLPRPESLDQPIGIRR